MQTFLVYWRHPVALIRTIGLEEGLNGWNLRTAAGGGIVADSDPRDERIETETKLSLIRRVLEGS